MPSTAAALLAFFFAAAAVVVAGIVLARSGDIIAARTRLGGVWIGSIFLALATSLPELVTDVAAVRLGAPDLAAGDLFGSSMANMLILALVNLVPGRHLFRHAALDHALSASLAILLAAIAAVFVTLPPQPTVLGVGIGSLLLVITYLGGTRIVFLYGHVAREAAATPELAAGAAAERPGTEAGLPTLRQAAVRFALAAGAILIAAPVFAASAERLAVMSGLGTTFVGTALLGVSTSLPELVTCLAAVRIRAYDLAVGNLFGSNAVNMLMFVPLDLAHGGAPILGAVSGVHAITALVAIALMALGLAGIVYRAKGRFSLLEPSSLLIALVYLAGLAVLFRSR